MKRLHSFILKSFLGPLTFTFFICMFVLLMQFLWLHIEDFVGKGLEWTDILEFMFYISATLVPMALPLAILLASIMSFGNMGENYELIAMKAAGISLQKIMRPLVILVMIIGLGAFYFSNYIMPIASLQAKTLLYAIRQQNPEMVLKEGVFTSDLPDFGIKVDKIDKETGMIYNLMIYDHRDRQGNTQVTVADSGTMKTSTDKLFMDLTLYSGEMYEEVKTKRKNRNKHPFQRVKFDLYKTTIDLPSNELKRSDEDRYKDSYRMLNLKQLSSKRDTLEGELQEVKERLAHQLSSREYFQKENKSFRKDSLRQILLNAKTWNADSLYEHLNLSDKLNSIGNALTYSRKSKKRISSNISTQSVNKKWIQKFVNEWHRKFTLSFACIIFFFIGAPLGAIIRKGGLGMPVIVSVLFFIIYYIISMTGERAARELVISPFLGMWISSMVILPLGVILTYKATTDSNILNIEAYINFFKKIKPTKLISKKMFKQIVFFVALSISLGACQSEIKTNPKEINTLLDNWHLAATNADLDAYFSALDEKAIYIGTDASERWTKAEFLGFCEPYFKKGKAWDFKAYDRKIYFSEDGQTAWFNELLNTWMGVCRASGILSLKDGEWKISHYQLSVTVKNENMKQFLEIK